MIQYICDRCGTSEGKYWFECDTRTIRPFDLKTNECNVRELCEECYKSFGEWFIEKEAKNGQSNE